MQLSFLVGVSHRVGQTRSRLAKRAQLSDCLRQAGSGEVALVVDYLSGTLPQGRIGVGPAQLRALACGVTAVKCTLSLRETDEALERIAGTRGKGSQRSRTEQLNALFARTTASERGFLVRLLLGELRQGALEGVLTDAIADAAGVPADAVRRAVMLAGHPSRVAEAVLGEGPAALSRFRLEPLSPVKPMLAQPAEDLDQAMQSLGEAALEYKLDGARVQIHKAGDEVRIFSRRLNDVTESLPEVVDVARASPSASLILDGEVIALRSDGRPLPFQVTMRRFGRRINVDEMRRTLPLSVYLFDCLHCDGTDLMDLPAVERFQGLAGCVPAGRMVPRIVTGDPLEAGGFLAAALEAGHEGVMAKSLDSAYTAGNRGAGWLKVKQVHTLDLVVLAAEWGSGRRRGRLSNLHLGARDPRQERFIMLGKTFKGLTDRMLDWQTQRLLEMETGREGHIVYVRPELVVEIAVNEIQASPQYPGGMALRFARVKRFRTDKGPREVDTIDAVRELFARRTAPDPPVPAN